MITPGLRGFVVDPEASAADAAQDLLPAARAALVLQVGFTLVAEHGARAAAPAGIPGWTPSTGACTGPASRSSSSTAAWSGRLLLTKADGTPQAEQPVTGWPPRRPGLAADLPACRCETGSWR